jgi:hypothetical protein
MHTTVIGAINSILKSTNAASAPPTFRVDRLHASQEVSQGIRWAAAHEAPAVNPPARLSWDVAPPDRDETGSGHLSDIVDRSGRRSQRGASCRHVRGISALPVASTTCHSHLQQRIVAKLHRRPSCISFLATLLGSGCLVLI